MVVHRVRAVLESACVRPDVALSDVNTKSEEQVTATHAGFSLHSSAAAGAASADSPAAAAARRRTKGLRRLLFMVPIAAVTAAGTPARNKQNVPATDGSKPEAATRGYTAR